MRQVMPQAVTDTAKDESEQPTGERRPRCVGLWLDAFHAHRIVSTPPSHDPDVAGLGPGEAGSARCEATSAASADEGAAIAPAVLLPRFRDEPPAFDFAWPPHPRGCGDLYPPEARVEPPALPGRLPAGYAWSMLAADHPSPWTWIGHGGREARMAPATAIAELARARLAWDTPPNAAAGSNPAAPIGLAISDAIAGPARERLQQALARTLPGAQLVNASTAAVLAALTLDDPPADTSQPTPHAASHTPQASSLTPQATHVLHLHLGFDRWHASLVELTWPDHASDAPRVKSTSPILDPMPGVGPALLHVIAAKAIEMSYNRRGPGPLWQLLWTTPWPREVLATLTGRREAVAGRRYGLSPHVCRGAFLRQQVRLPIDQALQCWRSQGVLYDSLLPEPPDHPALRDWRQAGRGRLKQTGRLPAMRGLVTGDLALLPDERGKPLGEQYLRQLEPNLQTIALQGRDLPDDLLARGAAEAVNARREA